VKRALLLLAVLAVPAASHAAAQGGEPVALVTAETENALLVVDLSSGDVVRRLPMPADPQNVETTRADDAAAVVSTRAGAVTLLSLPRLRVRRIFRGFAEPHIAAFSLNGRYLYVTDDARGQLIVIDVRRAKVASRLFVCFQAHHLAFRPKHAEAWIACGERAKMIVVVKTANPARPHRIHHLGTRGALVHDLAFSPDGGRLWLTYDDRSTIAVYDPGWPPRRLLTLAAGSPPQHVAFGRYAYVTSGNDGRLRVFSTRGRLHSVARTPAGSFNIGLGGGIVLTPSLTRGTLTQLRGGNGAFLWSRTIAPSARDAAFAVLP
jgi:DNA-binding beta-propeller fold protein YncE